MSQGYGYEAKNVSKKKKEELRTDLSKLAAGGEDAVKDLTEVCDSWMEGMHWTSNSWFVIQSSGRLSFYNARIRGCLNEAINFDFASFVFVCIKGGGMCPFL